MIRSPKKINIKIVDKDYYLSTNSNWIDKNYKVDRSHVVIEVQIPTHPSMCISFKRLLSFHLSNKSKDTPF